MRGEHEYKPKKNPISLQDPTVIFEIQTGGGYTETKYANKTKLNNPEIPPHCFVVDDEGGVIFSFCWAPRTMPATIQHHAAARKPPASPNAWGPNGLHQHSRIIQLFIRHLLELRYWSPRKYST